MVVMYDRVGAIAGGTAAGTYGAAVNVTIDTSAKHIIGFVVSAADPTYTTAEGSAGFLRFNSKSLNITQEVFPTGPYTTSGPATNSSGQAMVQEIVAVDWPCNGGEVVSVDYAPSTAITTARLVEVSLIYMDSEQPPADWKAKFPDVVEFKGSAAVAAQQLTVTRTALTAITIPAWAREIVGYKAIDLKAGAITAAEECLGYFEASLTLKGTTPQEIPTNALGATLGTPVGTGLYHDDIKWLPAWIPLRGKDETLTPYINLRTAVTTGNQVIFGVAYR